MQVSETIHREFRTRSIERRWPAGSAVIVVLILLALLPDRVRLVPVWVANAIGAFVLVPIAAVGVTRGNVRVLRIERVASFLFFATVLAGSVTTLARAIGEMLNPAATVGGIQLLASSIAIWVNNVLAFSLLYWQLDRGGPEARLRAAPTRPDWVFPQEDVRELVAPEWRPTFVDYLFLGFSTATAFSPTAAMPLTPRAMMLMMVESLISLITILVVAARSINILGG